MKKIVEIEMMNYKGEWKKESFELKKYGTAFQYERDVRNVAQKYGDTLDGEIALAVKYFPDVIGKETFLIEGLDSNLKFNEILEEFFVNDATALSKLVAEMGFFLVPALRMRMQNQS